MAKKKKKKTKPTFSKLLMTAIALMYFAVNVFVAVMICRIYSAAVTIGTPTTFSYIATPISAFLTFNSAVVAVGIGFYSNKAKAENMLKIGKQEEAQYDKLRIEE